MKVPGRRQANRLASTLRRLRESNGLSQEALAKKAGVTREYVNKLEAGHSDPSVRIALRLAQALGVSIATLVTGNRGS
jgi:transcriptional regulator with XRE-family HTH domain